MTAAATPDRRLAVAYLPVQRAMTVDAGALAGPKLRVAWFEPATGQRLTGGTLLTEGSITLTPPFAEDSVLTIESVS
jgi:hypothetical protein